MFCNEEISFFNEPLDLFAECLEKEDNLNLETSFLNLLDNANIKSAYIKNFGEININEFNEVNGFVINNKNDEVLILEAGVVDKGSNADIKINEITGALSLKFYFDIFSDTGYSGYIITYNGTDKVIAFVTGNDDTGYIVYNAKSVDNIKYSLADIYDSDNGFIDNGNAEAYSTDFIDSLEFIVNEEDISNLIFGAYRSNNGVNDISGCVVLAKSGLYVYKPYLKGDYKIKDYFNNKENRQFEIKDYEKEISINDTSFKQFENIVNNSLVSFKLYNNKLNFAFERISFVELPPKRVIIKDFDE